MADDPARLGAIGRWLMPPAFLLFFALAAICGPVGVWMLGWQAGIMVGFDIAGAGFLLKSLSLFDDRPEQMRRAAARNDANRALLLVTAVGVLFVILVTVAAELSGRGKPDPAAIARVILTLALAWTFATIVYATHYAHLYYLPGADGADGGGLGFPGETEPDYWDFVYFSATMGMTFQTSDVDVTSSSIRRVVLMHGLAAFVFNLGVLAFTVNVLGGG